MKGKVVNLFLGLMNLLLGIVILVFTLYIPQDISMRTIQEDQVIGYIKTGIFIAAGIIAAMDFIIAIIHRKTSLYKNGFFLAGLVVLFIIMQSEWIAAFSIVGAVLIMYRSLVENLIESNNMGMITITILIMFILMILLGTCLIYSYLGQSIKNKENKNELAYKKDYFKYITELDDSEVYINVKKDGKYGYINRRGEVLIDFKYDYASRFFNINSYGKNFKIAMVCENGSTKFIMKNERNVMSYKTESHNENYLAKQKEIYEVYEKTFEQTEPLKFESERILDSMTRRHAYQESEQTTYTYRYDYDEKYDFLVVESSLGLPTEFYLARKDNLEVRTLLNCKSVAYDENYLYVFRSGFIPFYNISDKKQGWFTSFGKKTEMEGNAQILEMLNEEYILLKSYNTGYIYCVNNKGEVLSPTYLDIHMTEDRYIAKNSETKKYQILDLRFNKVIEEEFDMIDTSLLSQGLYICANLPEKLSYSDYGYANIKYKILDYSGNVIAEELENVYDLVYKIEKSKDEEFSKTEEKFINDLKDVKCSFVGDELYKDANK